MEIDQRIEWADLPTERTTITLPDTHGDIDVILEPSDVERIYEQSAFRYRAVHNIALGPGFFYPTVGSFQMFIQHLREWWTQ